MNHAECLTISEFSYHFALDTYNAVTYHRICKNLYLRIRMSFVIDLNITHKRNLA